MNTSIKRLEYSDVKTQYQELFGVRLPAGLLKSVSLMDGGTQDLMLAMQTAVNNKMPMDFDKFARQFFRHLAAGQKAEELTSWEETPA